ncbi:MAG: Hydroxysqualene synthase [Calditrichaeota bacterium]|nr:Hydroxysqualene synthase [Calditrichota bacterium]
MPAADNELVHARRWCREYARRHAENFVIASRWLLPPEKRAEYFALYAFARGADQRADEYRALDDKARRDASEALSGWRRRLDLIYNGGEPDHPAFIALAPVIRDHGIERELFTRMLDAFERDQHVRRYESWRELRDYTRGSADPVGRWVLRVHGYRAPALDRWSDAICTGLQLVNFIQDLRADLEQRDRVYLPREELDRFAVTEAMFVQSPAPRPLRDFVRFQVARAERLFRLGRPLLDQVGVGLARQLILFHGGGRLALHTVRRANYDVTGGRVRAGRLARAALLTRALRGEPL